MFSGYGQHDSAELLNYLLDGLHEDLNRIKGPKPYVEMPSLIGQPEHLVAEYAWKYHLMRNQSVIIDLMQG